MHRKRDFIATTDNAICPRMQKKLEKSKLSSRGWIARWDGGHSYGVRDGPREEKYVVNLKDKSCACREWQLRGTPCLHAVAVIWANREQLENYICSLVYKTVVP